MLPPEEQISVIKILEEQISVIKSWCHAGHPANENKQNSHITRCYFDNKQNKLSHNEKLFSQLGTFEHCLSAAVVVLHRIAFSRH